MAYLGKQKITRWVDAGGKRVKANTPGAVKVVEESKRWYIFYKAGRSTKAIPAYTDKAASQKKLADWLQARERGEAELVSPYEPHLKAAIKDHVAAYVAEVTSSTRNAKHQKEVARILGVLTAGAKMQTLRDFTADALIAYLAGMQASAGTKNMHRRIAVMFGNWLERVKRLPANPVGGKRVKLAKGPKKRKRRALAVEEVRRLLAAAEERPLASARVNKGGRGAQGRPGGVPAKPKAATEARLRRAGRERRLLYRLALLTGLRRGELERLRVHHLDLARGWLALPGELTKNGKPAQLPLLAGLAGELREWFAAEGKGPDDPVVYVPAESNLARIHKANLKHAGIPYVTAAGAADFHALRKCTNTLLRLAGVPAKERQLFLRHHKLELTTETYDDETRADLGKAARALECLGI